MGKAKKGKRSNKEEDDDMFMDSDVDVDEQVIAPVKSKSKAKKNDKKKNNKDTDDVDDLTMDIDDEELVAPVKNKSKAKNKKKNNIKEDDDEDVSVDIDDEEVVVPVKSKSKAKNKKKNNKDFDDVDDLSVDIDDEEPVVPVKAKSKGKNKKNNTKDDVDDVDDLSVDIDDEELVVPVKAKSKAKNKKKNNKDFDDVDDLPVDIDDEEELVVPVKAKLKAKNKKKNIKEEIDDDMFVEDLSVDIEEEEKEELIAPVKSKSKGKNKKKNIKEDDDDVEDLPIDKEEEELVASVKSKLKVTDDKKMPVKENENDDLLIDSEDDSVKNKSKKKDNKKKDKVSGDNNTNKVNDNNEDDESGTVKTAAQKKKEKKEREKLKKMALKKSEHAKKAEGGPTKESSIEKTSKPVVDEVKKDAVVVVVDDGNVDDEEGGGKKKKKKGAKDDAKTNAKDSKKGPSKALLAQLLEERKRREEEEERLRREEEELERQAEAAEAARLAQLQLEQERKEKKKLKEKQRKERLKAEGKLLTDKQKQDRARAQQLLAESLKAQGLEVPEAGQKKPRTKLGTRLRPNKLKQQSSIEEKKLDVNIPDQVQLEIIDQKQQQQQQQLIKEAEKKIDEVKDSWDAVSSEEEEEEEEDKSEETVKAVTAKNNGKITDATGSKKNTELSDSGDSGSGSDSNSNSDDSDSDEEESIDEKLTDAEKKKERARLRIQNRRISADKKRTLDNLRAAVVCVLGHVDTGKTKILDKLRRTNVQDGEAGGITQQIGATNVPIDAIRESTKHVKGFADKEFKIPGLLIIDTPGHESFSNLRDRGSSLCDISVLVIDIMHGLEPQTIESIKLLRAKKCPFVVALNKIDRLYDWETMNRKDVQDIINAQGINTKLEFEKRSKEVIIQLAEQGLNAAIFYDNPDPRTYVSLVPTSAITGEGMGNLLALLINACQGPLAKRLMYSDELQATVLEVKALPGLGTTIDCILVNGTLKEGDTMIVAGSDGPIVTQIRSLLMPQPLKELRVKNSYVEYREIKAAQGVKIAAKDLEKAIAGLNLAVAQKPDEIDLLKEEISKELSKALGNMKLVDRGVFVQASTLGALEALLDFLRSSKIPYAGIRIGPVVKKDVMKASIMLEHDSQYATILAFDVKIERDAQDLADTLGVKIFQADIIYHLFDKFTAYREELKQRRRDEHKHIAVFPCKLRVVPGCIFKTRDPIVIGVMVEAGIVKEGTPVCVIKKDAEKGAEIDKQRINLGVVSSIEINHKFVESARKGQEVCVKIEPIPGDAPKMFGRHFDETDMIISTISRESIDACKNYFRDDLLKSDWQLMVELKKLFEIL